MFAKLNFILTISFLTLVQCSEGLAKIASQKALKSQLHASEANGNYELAVLSILDSIQSGQLEHAVELADAHLLKFPKSQVGHLLRADALTALTGQLNSIADKAQLPEASVAGLTHQIKNRSQHRSDHELFAHQRIPSSLLVLGDHPYVVVTDMSQGRLYLYQNINGEPKLVRDYYMSVGSEGYGKQVEGDNKTPIGIYAINRYIEGPALPDLYGKGAFPVDYPNRYY